MKKTSVRPNSVLSKYIDRIYVLEYSGISETECPVILPGTGLELMFHLENPFRFKGDILPVSHIICPREKLKLENITKIKYLSVRFKCGTFQHFSPIPYPELNNTFLSVKHIWGKDGEGLEEQLHETDTLENKIYLIENFLLSNLQNYNNEKYLYWDYILNDIYNNNRMSFSDYASNMKFSLRQFERNFKKFYGITPKRFERIGRLQKSVKAIVSSKMQNNYLPTVLDKGYYDQSHFIKDFNALAGTNPFKYFENELYSVNYYDESTYKWRNL